MAQLSLLHRLLIPTPAGSGHKSWLSAASGLVCLGQRIYVIADDELHLHRFVLDAARDQLTAETSLRLFDGDLPAAVADRKRAKPDLESLMLLPALKGMPFGALLTLGSGSKPNRCSAVLLPLDATGGPTGKLMHCDLEPLYAKLQKRVDDLNIEGAFVQAGRLRLLQRGNKGKHAQNAVLHFDATDFAQWLLEPGTKPPKLQAYTALDFGSVQGVPLCPTDGTPLADGRWLTTLVAEDTDDSYQDGRCVASAVAILDANDQVQELLRLSGDPKVEGIALAPASVRQGNVLLVTDPDNRELAAELLALSLPSLTTVRRDSNG